MPRKTAKKPEDLYACYLRHEKATKKGLLEITINKSSRRWIRKRRPWSRRVFMRKWNALPAANRAEVERIYRTPYRKLIADAMRVAKEALQEFDVNPVYRKRVARKLSRLRRKALQPA